MSETVTKSFDCLFPLRIVEEAELLVFSLQIFHVKRGEMAVNQRSEELSVEECEAEPSGRFLTEISSDSL